MKNCKEEGEEAMSGAAADEEAAAIAEEGNKGPAMEIRLCGGHVSFGHDHGGPAMEVHLCGGHVSFGHDHGGPTMEVLWWSGEKRAER